MAGLLFWSRNFEGAEAAKNLFCACLFGNAGSMRAQKKKQILRVAQDDTAGEANLRKPVIDSVDRDKSNLRRIENQLAGDLILFD